MPISKYKIGDIVRFNRKTYNILDIKYSSLWSEHIYRLSKGLWVWEINLKKVKKPKKENANQKLEKWLRGVK